MSKYIPTLPASISSFEDMLEFITRENTAIAIAIASHLENELPELHAAPTKPRAFMIVAADGTDWNPGSGQGVYAYYAAAWHFLG